MSKYECDINCYKILMCTVILYVHITMWRFSIAGGTGALTAAQKAATAAPLHASLWLRPYCVRGVSSSVFDAGEQIVAVVLTVVKFDVVCVETYGIVKAGLFVKELLQMVKQYMTIN